MIVLWQVLEGKVSTKKYQQMQGAKRSQRLKYDAAKEAQNDWNYAKRDAPIQLE